LAQVHREGLVRKGVSPTRAAAASGISRHRLRKLLAGETPMTTDEHKALSEVGS
jgi:plasmid maintenance system antidote protein VapI